MLTSLIKEYQRQVDHVARLEKGIEEERTAALAALPAEYGYPDMDSFIRAVRRAAALQGRKKITREKRAPRGLARTGGMTTTATPKPDPTSSAVQSAQVSSAPDSPPSKPLPKGDSLDDPANFGLLPDASLLTQGALDLSTHQNRLRETLAFARKVLHTSRVPAKVWREWRDFECKVVEAMRASHAGAVSS